MDKMLYIAMAGAKQVLQNQAVNTNNLANVNTTAFREDLSSFSTLDVYGDGHETRSYPALNNQGVNFTPGTLVATSRDLDVAVEGEGFIAIQGDDGGEAYTREGSLRVTPNGLLVTSKGDSVLSSNGGPIALPPHDKIEIGADGTITILPTGQDASALAVVDRIKLVQPNLNDLSKGYDGNLYGNAGEILPADANVTIMSGFLESSNVNALNSMVTMIEQSRMFEMDIKLMSTAEEIDKKSSELLRVS